MAGTEGAGQCRLHILGVLALSFPFSVEDAFHASPFLFDVWQEQGQGSLMFSIYEPWKEEPQ